MKILKKHWVAIVLAVVSFLAFSLLISWKFALIIMFSLFIHESGHVWAMKKCGVPVQGMYFIPLLGMVAVMKGMPATRKNEVFIAIMGPIWGLVLASLSWGVYLLTGWILLAASVQLMACINLFNLAPISPLDGGRIAKSIAFSLHPQVARVFYWLCFIACVVVFVLSRHPIFLALTFIAWQDYRYESSLLKLSGQATKEGAQASAQSPGLPVRPTNLSAGNVLASAVSYCLTILLLLWLFDLAFHIASSDFQKAFS